MLRKITGGWRFLLIYLIGFSVCVLFYTMTIYGRIQPLLAETRDYRAVYDKMWELVWNWSALIFAAMLIALLLTFRVRARLMAHWRTSGRREVFGALAAVSAWLAVALIAVPIHLYINWRSRYSEFLINGEQFYGPSPEYVSMYLGWFVILALPTMLACAFMFRWRKQAQ